MESEQMKECSKCGKLLPLTEFYIRKDSKDGRDYKCKECAKKYAQWFRDNRPERAKEISKKTREKNRERIRAREREKYAIAKNNPEYISKRREEARNRYLKENMKRRNRAKAINENKPSCEKCGESRWWVLQYHHIDPQTKQMSIGAQCTSRKTDTLEKEIKKCASLCANCHKEFHFLYGAKPRNPILAYEEYIGRKISKQQLSAIRDYYGLNDEENQEDEKK